MRQQLNVTAYCVRVIPQFLHPKLHFGRQVHLFSFNEFQLHCQHRKTLGDIVVKFSCDPGALLLLCFPEFAIQSQERLFCLLALGDIQIDANHP
jgi:hypothetical protein